MSKTLVVSNSIIRITLFRSFPYIYIYMYINMKISMVSSAVAKSIASVSSTILFEKVKAALQVG